MTDFTALWGWPQWTMAILAMTSLAMAAIDHGKPRIPHNFPLTLVCIGINLFILICGGFYG